MQTQLAPSGLMTKLVIIVSGTTLGTTWTCVSPPLLVGLALGSLGQETYVLEVSPESEKGH